MKNKLKFLFVFTAVLILSASTVCMADTTIYKNDFNVADMSYSDFVENEAKKKDGFTWKFSNWNYAEAYASLGFTSNDYDSVINKIGADTTNTVIEDGRLKIMKNGSYSKAQNITTLEFPKYYTGQLSVKFDVELKSYGGYTTRKFDLLDGENTAANLGSNAYTLFVGHQSNGGQYPIGGSWNFFKDKGTVAIEMILDYDRGKFWVYYDGILNDGVKDINKTTNNGVNKFRIYTTGSGNDDAVNIVLYVDNLEITQLDKAKITSSSVSDGTIGAEVTKPQFTFSVPVLKRGVTSTNGFKLYEMDTLVEDADFALSDDGLSLTLNQELKYSTPYKIEIGDTVVTQNKLYLPAQSISFHTKHKPADLNLEDIAFINSDTSLPVTSLAGVKNLKVAAGVSNTSGTSGCPVILMLAIYDSDGVMQQVKCASATVDNGNYEPLGVSVSLPEGQTGTKAIAYVWNSLDKMELIHQSEVIE